MFKISFAPRAYLASIVRDVRGVIAGVICNRAALVSIIVLLLPWWALVFLREKPDWLWSFGEIIVVLFAFWWMSRSGGAPPAQVKYPRAESLFAIVLIGLWIVWRAGICGKFFPFLPAEFTCFKNIEFETVPKVLEQVVVPILVLYRLGYRWHAMGLDWSWRAWWITFPILLAGVVYGIAIHWGKLPEFGKNFAEYFFAAGLPEEMLFRALLLTRLEAWWRDPVWALFGSAVIFGISHLPIDYLVFTNRNWNEAWITWLTFQMSFGAVFAFAYQRTRNVLPLAILHGLIDAL